MIRESAHSIYWMQQYLEIRVFGMRSKCGLEIDNVKSVLM